MKFLSWARTENYESWDYYDLWATKLARQAKMWYQKHPSLGLVGLAPFVLLDLVLPGCRRALVPKRGFPICHAHLGIGSLNLFQITGDAAHVEAAKSLVPDLLSMASPETSGLGWGMKFEWPTLYGVVPRDSPCNTQTSYAYDLFAALHALTGNSVYEGYLERIALHIDQDFPEWREGSMISCSYSTQDTRRVVNANSYRMAMLVDAGSRFSRQDYVEKGMATAEYVMSMQRPDGSWPYSEDEVFTDTFHTCFVLKNLNRASRRLGGDERIEAAIERGLEYYLKNLFDSRGFPIPFAIKPRTTLYRYDSYDFAESIGLLSELRIERERLMHLLRYVRASFQTNEGWFRFRITPLVGSRGLPYMRWANSALFLAMTKAIRWLQESPNETDD